MSSKLKRELTRVVLVLALHLYPLQLCHSEPAGGRWGQIHGERRADEKTNHSANLRKTSRSGPQGLRSDSAASPGETLPPFILRKVDKRGRNVTSNNLSWTNGHISTGPKASAQNHEEGYQADFTGLHGVQGKVLGPSLDSSPHFPEWQAMRPFVQCDENVMTFTASGQGLRHLLVDREAASPISLFQLPPNCGYSVRTSWSDLEMRVPYDACYITQENDSYVLPMLWWDTPLKLSCPVQPSTPAPSPSLPSVFCSPYGMAVQKRGQEQEIPMLGVKVNGGWRPFVSEECVYLVHSRPDELTFFISYKASCITIGDGLSLQLVYNDQEYILSCPVNPQLHFITDPTLSPEQISQSHQLPLLPLDPTQYSSGLYYPHMPFYYPAVTPAPTFAATETTTTTTTTVPPSTHPPGPPAYPYYPHYYFPIPYYPAPTAAPATLPLTSPSPPPSTSPPNHPADPQPPFPHPYYPYYYPFFPPFYHPPYHPFLPQYPEILTPATMTKPPPTTTTVTTTPTTTATTPTPTTTSTTPSTTTQHATQMPHLQCLMGRMVVFLPFAHQDSIQVKDQRKTWLPLSTVSPLCGYMLQMVESSGVILHSPLPACHSLSRTPTTISLPLMFWDLSMAQYRTLEPQCPYESTPVTLAPVTPPASTTPPSTSPSPEFDTAVQKPKVSCSSHHMTVKLPSGPISGILLKDMKGNPMSLQDAPEHCEYSASKGKDGKIQLSLRLQSQCHMSVQGNMYIISIVYITMNEGREAQVSCPVVVPGPGKECNLPSDKRLPCGPAFVSQPQCLSMGCCFSKHSDACYYPMDECTIDHHFVFSVPASITEPPLSLAHLVAGSDSTCRPQRVTSEYALFKIPMEGCGARRVVVGQLVSYMVEVVNKVQGISVNHGTITRDSPVRLLVECRFQPGSVLTVSYMVKTPTLGPGVQTQEMYGVQLRIAKDPEYSSYFPQYHQPMQMLLGKPLYLEVRLLNAPDPGVVLLVHFCVAYPRSGTSVWVLLYNGCPNPLDPAPHQAVLSAPRPSSPQGQTRRFTISTFKFLPDGEFKDPNEEIYFMCSTEICSPRDGPCVEGCFGQSRYDMEST